MKQLRQKGVSTEELPCSYRQVRKKNDILITLEEGRAWLQKKRNEKKGDGRIQIS